MVNVPVTKPVQLKDQQDLLALDKDDPGWILGWSAVVNMARTALFNNVGVLLISVVMLWYLILHISTDLAICIWPKSGTFFFSHLSTTMVYPGDERLGSCKHTGTRKRGEWPPVDVWIRESLLPRPVCRSHWPNLMTQTVNYIKLSMLQI